MKDNRSMEKQPMTQKQKQAVIVCALCALAIVITASVTGVLVSKKIAASKVKEEEVIANENGYNADKYIIDTTSSALLGETADAGDAYLKETLFLGDSNTVRFYNNGLLTLQQFCAEQGLGIQEAVTKKFVTFKGDSQEYSIPEAVAMMKPRRVVITLGTNNGDGSMTTEAFITEYKALISAIQASYAYTDIIVNAVPPIPAVHSTYPNMDQGVIDEFNMALAEMCEAGNLKFLNSAEVLKDESGYGKADYYVGGDVHLKSSGLKAILNYVTTHASDADDARPDTSNIPTRSQSGTSNVVTATTSPTSTPSVKYKATYLVESGGGGTLSCGSDTGKTSLSYDITDANMSLSVTAVPSKGFIFVKWSDGVTKMTRTDKDFKQNVNVTALFASASITIAGSNTTTLGSSYTVTATVNGKYSSAEGIHWYVNGTEVTDAVGKASYTFTVESKAYEIYAVLVYNENSIPSDKIAIALATATPTAVPTAVPTTVPTAVPTAEPTAVPTAEPTAVPTAEPTTAPTAEPTAEPTAVSAEGPTEGGTVAETSEQV